MEYEPGGPISIHGPCARMPIHWDLGDSTLPECHPLDKDLFPTVLNYFLLGRYYSPLNAQRPAMTDIM